MKYIIINIECLRSKIIYSNFLKKNKKIKKNYPKSSNTAKSNFYSFPSWELELKIKEINIKTLSLCNYFFILQLSIIKDIDKLYSVIKKYLNK